ncbi:nuclear pore complex protein Nup155 [Nematocida displodere]|uniref:Nuclear pore complex protein Nup155 n=1 Tax=Nematocida displodere TaxID=1805483 RepID=A0A177EJM5_9MICR|nr:nuclear pore complex protein Nup155 [Nematocida displodere]
MDKYNEVQRAAVGAKNTLGLPEHTVKDFSTSSYTFDASVFKKKSVPFPREISEVMQAGGNIGTVDGLNLVWASERGRVVLWNFAASLVHEIETKTSEVLAIYPIQPKAGTFIKNVHSCLLLFTDAEVSLVCLCTDPIAFVETGAIAGLPVQMSAVCETRDERVFLGGIDGNIYEFVYGCSRWTGNNSASVTCLTSGLLSHLLPFIYAMGKRTMVLQILPTKRGFLVLYEDGVVDAFDTQNRFRKIRTADLSPLKIRDPATLQMLPINGGGYEVYLMLPNGERAFLDGGGFIAGRRTLPPNRTQRVNRGGVPQITTQESFYSIGKHLVILGKTGNEGVVSVISPNRDKEGPAENCSTIFASSSGYLQAALASQEFTGRQILNPAEKLLMGEELVLLAPDRIDTFQIMEGVEYMERATTNPEGLMLFKQRNGPEHTLHAALYAIALGNSSIAIENLFKKTTDIHRHVISDCMGSIIYSLWDRDLLEVLAVQAGNDLEANLYLEELERAIEKLQRLKMFVLRHSTSQESLRLADGHTVTDGISDVIETLQYIAILFETDALYVLSETYKQATLEEDSPAISLSTLVYPDSRYRKTSLEILVDLHLRQKASIEGISEALNEKCPTLFALSDSLYLRGKEAIEKATRATTKEDKNWYLEKSINFFQKASRDQIPAIVEAYAKIKYSRGILYIVRAVFNQLTKEESVAHLSRAICTEEFLKEGLQDERASFCTCLLDAVIVKIKNNEVSIDILLKAKSRYLEEYLNRLDETSDDIELCDLVWKYHLKNHTYQIAALYLLRTAERARPFITLQKRIEYLAIACTMQAASGPNHALANGPIKEFAPKLGKIARDRLDMAQKQLDVMSAVADIYNPENIAPEVEDQISSVFVRLETELLGYEELFEICVTHGFSLLALKISTMGLVDDDTLHKQLWNDVLSGDYNYCVRVLQDNKVATSSVSAELLGEILLKKRLAYPEGKNVGLVLLGLGYSSITVARIFEEKAESTEYASPKEKRAVLNEAVAFCESQNLSELAHRMTCLKTTLGL